MTWKAAFLLGSIPLACAGAVELAEMLLEGVGHVFR